MTASLSAGAARFAGLNTPLLALALPSGAAMTSDLEAVNAATGGALSRAFSRRDFRGGRDEVLHLGGAESGIQRVLLVGIGKVTDRVSALRRAGAIAARQASKLGVGSMAFHAGDLDEASAEAVGVGIIVGSWDFRELKTPPPAEEQRALLDKAIVLSTNPQSIERGVANASAIGEGHSLARRLGMLPGNVCTPDYLAQTA